MTDQGNHFGLISGDGAKQDEYNYTPLALVHFQFRGFTHFVRKCVDGSKTYGYDTDYLKLAIGGHHWRNYYRYYLRDVIDMYYRRSMINKNGTRYNEFSQIISENRQ